MTATLKSTAHPAPQPSIGRQEGVCLADTVSLALWISHGFQRYSKFAPQGAWIETNTQVIMQ
ncbi:hypothetical protein [Thiomonas sp.]